MKKDLIFVFLKALLGFVLSLIPLGLLIFVCINNPKFIYILLFGVMFIYLFAICISWLIELKKKIKEKK